MWWKESRCPGSSGGLDRKNLCFPGILKKEEASVLKGREYEIVEDRVFKTMSDTMTPQGILAVVRQPGE